MFIKMSIKHRWSLLWTLLLIFQLYGKDVDAAPTKHLKITAKGDTPRLIVTSEEDFGTEPKRLVAAKSKNYKISTTTTTTSQTLLAKEEEIADKSYETDLEKNIQIPTSMTTTDKLLFNNNAKGKDFPTTTLAENKYAVGETTTTTAATTATTKNTILKHQYATTGNMLLQQIETTTISLLAAKLTTLGQSQKIQEPIQIQKNVVDNKNIKESIHDDTMTTTTTVKNIIEKMPKMGDKVEKKEVTPLAEHELLSMEEHKKYISTTMKMPITTSTNTQSPVTMATNIAAIDKLNDKMMISNSEKKTHTHPPPTPPQGDKHMSTVVSVATNTDKHEKQIEMATKPTTTMTNSIEMTTPATPEKPTSTMDIMLNDQATIEENVGAVRLLDLEKQQQNKSYTLEQKHQSTKLADVNGHDGIKKTKKKQLKIDKYLLADIGMTVPSTVSTSTSIKQKVKKSGKLSTEHSLGPIHMDEQVFSLKQITTKPTSIEQIESKISDIQVEIYDSTVDSLLTSALKPSTTKTPTVPGIQEKFTQYVIDRVESSTPESNLLPTLPGDFGKPEPAAIEIHINVSEGIGNGSEDLEFSYPQTNFEANEVPIKTVKVSHTKAKNSSNTDEILVVEIIDSGDNSTDNTISAENIHPVFTFRTDQSVNEIEFKDNMKTSKATQTDELFMAEVKPEVSIAPAIVPRPAMEHDSDTIFYISNTEVKVGESTKSKQKSKLNVPYMFSTHPNLIQNPTNSRRYEEDILLSSLQNTADSLKIFRSQNEENAPPLDVTYVGESVMEVEQLPPEDKEQATSTAAPSHVIIQPASLSEIGVPVIGELPPQIELKEFDFMPDELTNHGSVSGAEEESEQTLVGNDVERLVESSIQYGGDLIDEGAVDNGGGFDGAEGSYPFGNLATMGRHGRQQNAKRKHAAAHFNVNHGVNNLRKDELTVDINGNSRDVVDAPTNDESSIQQLNGTLKWNAEQQTMNHNMSDATMNITFAVAERMTNGTLASIMENPKRKSLNVNEEYYWGIVSLIASVIIATLPVITIFAFFCTVRYFYHKYHSHANENDKSEVSQQAKIDGSGKLGAENSQSTELQTPSSDIRHLENETTTNCTLLVDEQNKPKSKPSSGEAENKNIELTEAQNRNNTHSFLDISQFTNFLPRLEFKGSNGSVTKMTLKYNQLIIETEERNDISRNARETKMHYNNSTGKDGVFVVEVSRGVDSQQIPESPLSETAATFIQTTAASMSTTKPNSLIEKNEKSPTIQEEVQVHEPPKDIEENKKLNQIPEVEEEQTDVLRSNTGLSQSDLSSSSSPSHSNKAYVYGNQTLYAEDTNSIAKDISKVIKLQHEMTPIKADDDDQNESSQNLQKKVNDESAFNEMNVQQKETIANEAIEMDNKLQMQVTTESVVEAVVEPKDVVETEHNIETNNNANDNVIHITENKEEGIIEKQEAGNIEKCINSNLECAFDSLMSLPEPPSYEEIKEISISSVGDTTQLDSLPPPPPPPLFVAEQEQKKEDVNVADENALNVVRVTVENEEALQQYAFNNIKIVPPPPSSCTTAEIELNNGKQLLSTQLTPPESPPGANCANNRGNTGICLPLPALVVNVNGS